MADERDDVEAAIDGLYKLPIADFTRMRNALAKQLKSAGRKTDSDRVKALKKPNVSAWVVNQLWWDHDNAFGALLDAGEAIRKAQTEGAGPARQRDADARRREAIGQLLGLARQQLESSGKAVNQATLRRITTTLEACAAHGHSPPEPGPGRLHDDLDPPGFDVLAALAGFAPARTPLTVVPDPPADDDASAGETAVEDEADDDPRAAELDAAQARLDAATEAAQAALQALDDATSVADESREEAKTKRDAWELAEQQAEAAVKRAAVAKRALEQAEQAAKTREDALAQAQAAAQAAQAELAAANKARQALS